MRPRRLRKRAGASSRLRRRIRETLKQTSIIAPLIACCIISLVVYGLNSTSVTIHNSATVYAVGVGVYSDAACTQALTSINWGTLQPSQVTSSVIYMKNTGNANVVLSMISDSWNPALAQAYISVSWTAENSLLAPSNVEQATIMLSVNASIQNITSFTFDIHIIGTGQ